MKIVLHSVNYSNFLDRLIALRTGFSSGHCSVIDEDGDIWDTTLSRGKLAKNQLHKKHINHTCIVFDLPNVFSRDWLVENEGLEYDAVGLAFWLFGLDSRKKAFCFEIPILIARSQGFEINPTKEKPSAKTLSNWCLDNGISGEFCKTKDLLKG